MDNIWQVLNYCVCIPLPHKPCFITVILLGLRMERRRWQMLLQEEGRQRHSKSLCHKAGSQNTPFFHWLMGRKRGRNHKISRGGKQSDMGFWWRMCPLRKIKATRVLAQPPIRSLGGAHEQSGPTKWNGPHQVSRWTGIHTLSQSSVFPPETPLGTV